MVKRVGIIGPGAIGLHFYSLIAPRVETVLFDHNEKRVRDLQGQSLRVKDGEKLVSEIPFSVTADLSKAADCDLLILAVKSYSTEKVSRDLQSSLGEFHGDVLSLQNGLGNRELIQKYLSSANVLSASVYVGSVKTADNEIELQGVEGFLFEESSSTQSLKEFIRKTDSDIKVTLASNRDFVVQKGQVNCMVNGLSAIFRVKNGFFVENQWASEIFKKIDDECVEVFEKLYPEVSVSRQFERTIEACRMSMTNSSSMHEDIRNGRRTEIQALNGFVSANARELGIKTPWNDWITRRIDNLENLASVSRSV